MTSLLALDPGGTTGWSTFFYDATTPLQLIAQGQWERGIYGFIAQYQEALQRYEVNEVVSESFVLDGRTANPDVTPLRIEGAIAALTPAHVPVVYQRNTFKSHADDLLLKRAGLWFVGQEHSRDSARHAVAFLKTRRHMPTLRALWPPRGMA